MSSAPGTGQAGEATRRVITVGVDLADVTEVRECLRELGESYLERVFTSSEAAYGLQAADPATELASIFAVKEAVVKVLADVQPPWTAIEVSPRPEGGLDVRLAGEAAYFAELRGIDSFAVNVSLEGALATAVVFAMGAS
jgi:phosphopantetheine--protein transferase-like protein